MALAWDDHEVQNNYGADNSLYGVPPELFVHRRAVAYRAYYENLPLALDSLPQGPDGHIYRRYDIGSLARVHLLDTRQYRDPLPVDEADRVSEKRTIMGAEQEPGCTTDFAARARRGTSSPAASYSAPSPTTAPSNGTAIRPTAAASSKRWAEPGRR